MRFGERTRPGQAISNFGRRPAAGGATYGTATGGSSSSITVSGQNYTLLTFTSSGTLTVTKAGLFDLLILGGGGGTGSGGGHPSLSAGGGGGGGRVEVTTYFDANQTVTVGAGGGAGSGGSASMVGRHTIVGGASGWSVEYGQNQRGSCAGGGSNYSATNVSGITNIYNDSYFGGNTGGNGTSGGGGGAGIGGNGNAGSSGVGGNGGAGIDISTFLGQAANTTLKGGGGGGGSGGSGWGSGGSGGGAGSAGSASANTSGGGGGGGYGLTGGSGGSGIVYVRFKV